MGRKKKPVEEPVVEEAENPGFDTPPEVVDDSDFLGGDE